MGTGSFPGVRWPVYGADNPPHLSSEVMKEYYSPSGPSWPVIGRTFTLCDLFHYFPKLLQLESIRVHLLDRLGYSGSYVNHLLEH